MMEKDGNTKYIGKKGIKVKNKNKNISSIVYFLFSYFFFILRSTISPYVTISHHF